MAKIDRPYELGAKVLYGFGKVQQLNVIGFGRVYEDKNILIEGAYPLDLQDKELTPYESICVGIKLASNSEAQPVHFGLDPTHGKNVT